jgi:hypothetical protein
MARKKNMCVLYPVLRLLCLGITGVQPQPACPLLRACVPVCVVLSC